MSDKLYKAKPGTFPEKGELKIDYECILSDDWVRKFYGEAEINILRHLRDKAEKEYNTLIRLYDAETLILDKVLGYKATDFASSHEHIKVREQVLDCLAKIRKLRTVYAEPVRHAMWIRTTDVLGNEIDICSWCKEEAVGYDGHYGDYITVPTDYCPHCGAKMDGERDE